ncbi:hypothetical protein D3C75_1127500 [compost metagenome]
MSHLKRLKVLPTTEKGNWVRAAPTVPPITMRKAGRSSRALGCPPSMMLPPRMAARASSKPIRLICPYPYALCVASVVI